MATTTPDRPQGWSRTRTGILLHFFSYNPNSPEPDTPKAECHWGLKLDPRQQLHPEPPAGAQVCDTCRLRRQHLEPDLEPEPEPTPAAELVLRVGCTAQVTRGKMMHTEGRITRQEPQAPGFWYLQPYGSVRELLFNGDQLKART